MTKSPDALSKKLRLHFVDVNLIKTALTHRSAGSDNNERLEYLGDSILGFVIAEYLYTRFPEADEGILSRLRSGLVNQDSLAGLAKGLGLGDYLIMGPGELKSGGFRKDSILSDTLEALIGALFKDQGFEACKSWVIDLFAERFQDLSLATWKKDPKTRLQELLQSKGLDLPIYTLKSTDGLPHQQCFRIECKTAIIEDPVVGLGSSRKKAEQQAAEKILSILDL